MCSSRRRLARQNVRGISLGARRTRARTRGRQTTRWHSLRLCLTAACAQL
jgi:hypothetical protein